MSHFSPRDALQRTLESLTTAVSLALTAGQLASVKLALIDNSQSVSEATALQQLLEMPELAGLSPHLIQAPDNRGYGAANNLSILHAASDFHLILNPDVVLDEGAISAALAAMHAHPACVLLTPRAVDRSGAVQHVAKDKPGAITLLARALPLSPRLKDLLGNRQYELRDMLVNAPTTGRFLAGGCFMFCRTHALQRAGGFDEGYFMYFEDFDLSARLTRAGDVLYCPAVCIVHGGGGAAGKGFRHILWFSRSAGRFFRQHGWRWKS